MIVLWWGVRPVRRVRGEVGAGQRVQQLPCPTLVNRCPALSVPAGDRGHAWRGQWDRVLGGLGLAGLTGKEEAAGWADLRG